MYVITRVDKAGRPLSPKKNAQKWGNALAAIVRETLSINKKSIRGKDDQPWRELLLSRMRKIYQFNDDDRDLQKSFAVGTFTTPLSSWIYHANKVLDEKRI